MDSAVTLAEALRAGFAVHALSFEYGQRHAHELAAARRVARELGAVEHRVLAVDLRAIGGSALTSEIPVPKGRTDAELGAGVPPTYVPARNTIFLALALAFAEVIGADDLFLGVNALDSSGYPDCRPAFLEAFESLANVATRAGAEGRRLRIHAPLVSLTKREIVLRAEELGVDLGLTHTCYDPMESEEPGERGGAVLACGRCDACLLRLRGFREAGRIDPLRYAERGR
jgi:7-cyano-7-deazaguanine synthase